MAYKTILVHLDTGQRRRVRLELALALADRHGAHLVGFFGLQRLEVAISAEAAPLVIQAMMDARRTAAEEAEQEFREITRREGYEPRSEWLATTDDGYAGLTERAKYADLVVAGQPDPDGGVPSSFSRDLVMSVARPVLYVPRVGSFPRCGERVLVPWNASREAARATRDALPFLQRSRETEVVTFDERGPGPGREALPDPDIGAWLARHEARVTVALRPAAGIDVGSAILSRAADSGSDLIVMGAYSHSRLRELVLGGATRTLFESMTVPTLMSH